MFCNCFTVHLIVTICIYLVSMLLFSYNVRCDFPHKSLILLYIFLKGTLNVNKKWYFDIKNLKNMALYEDRLQGIEFFFSILIFSILLAPECVLPFHLYSTILCIILSYSYVRRCFFVLAAMSFFFLDCILFYFQDPVSIFFELFLIVEIFFILLLFRFEFPS